MTRTIYHVCRAEDWAAAAAEGAYHGSDDDRRDGFIHFSTAAQLEASVAKHRAGQERLLLLAVATERLGDALKWEASRGGQLFPHLYAPLRPDQLRWSRPLPLGADGRHSFPPLED